MKICFLVYLQIDCHGQNFQVIGSDLTNVSHPLRHVAILNNSTIVAVGGYGWGTGSIIKSTDYGESWSKTEVLRNLFQVTFVNDSLGYAVGEGATIMKTTDAGENWMYQNTSIISPAFQLKTVAFANNDTGFVGTANGPGFAYLYTYNGGETWMNVEEEGSVYGRARIQVVNDSTVYSLGYGHGAPLYRSNNLGQFWEEVSFPEDVGAPRDMYFFDRDTGIAIIREFDANCGSNFYFLRTNDAGVNWYSQYYNCTFVQELCFPSRTVGFALGLANTTLDVHNLWWTVDGGENWDTFEYSFNDGSGGLALSISCVDSDTCYMPANNGSIIKMTNPLEGTVSAVPPLNLGSFNIHPNPTSSYLTLTGSALLPGSELKVYNVAGQQVYSEVLPYAHETHTLDARRFGPAGLYLLHLNTPGHTPVVKKVVVQE